MTQRIPRGQPIHTSVDQLISEAVERGEFDNLPGAGKPLPGIDKPLDEDWWVKQKIRDEEIPGDALLPPALQLRKELRALPDAVRNLPNEDAVREAVGDVNQRVVDWIRAPSGPVLPVAPARVEDIVEGWRQARAESGRAESPQSSAAADDSDDGIELDELGRAKRPWWRRLLRRQHRPPSQGD